MAIGDAGSNKWHCAQCGGDLKPGHEFFHGVHKKCPNTGKSKIWINLSRSELSIMGRVKRFLRHVGAPGGPSDSDVVRFLLYTIEAGDRGVLDGGHDGKMECLKCGLRFRDVGLHAVSAHHMSPAKYRKMNGLPDDAPLRMSGDEELGCRSKQEALAALVAAGIYTKSGRFIRPKKPIQGR